MEQLLTVNEYLNDRRCQVLKEETTDVNRKNKEEILKREKEHGDKVREVKLRE